MKRKLLKIIGIIFGSLTGLVLAVFAIYVILYYPRKAESFEINTLNPTQKILIALNYFPRVDVKAACEAIALEQERYQALYPNLVNSINRVGYQYLRLKDVQSALEIFKLNVSLFPDSWNVYDSYGEALLINGDRESAIRNYRKAVQINPDSKSANDMLEKLGKE